MCGRELTRDIFINLSCNKLSIRAARLSGPLEGVPREYERALPEGGHAEPQLPPQHPSRRRRQLLHEGRGLGGHCGRRRDHYLVRGSLSHDATTERNAQDGKVFRLRLQEVKMPNLQGDIAVPLQGDTSGCSLGFVDNQIKVAF